MHGRGGCTYRDFDEQPDHDKSMRIVANAAMREATVIDKAAEDIRSVHAHAHI